MSVSISDQVPRASHDASLEREVGCTGRGNKAGEGEAERRKEWRGRERTKEWRGKERAQLGERGRRDNKGGEEEGDITK